MTQQRNEGSASAWGPSAGGLVGTSPLRKWPDSGALEGKEKLNACRTGERGFQVEGKGLEGWETAQASSKKCQLKERVV